MSVRTFAIPLAFAWLGLSASAVAQPADNAAAGDAGAVPVAPPVAPPQPAEEAPPEPTLPSAPSVPAGAAVDARAAKEDVAEVRVIGDKADSLPKVPGSGTVVSRKEIERAQAVETAELLRRVPGIQAREDFGGGGRLDIGVRGLDAGRSRRVLLLEDGMPMALNPYTEPDMYFAPPIERYRSIEVVKGGGNILFGPQTLAGTINFVTLAPPEKRTLTLDADAGTYGYARGLVRYGDAVGDTRYVVQALHRRGDGYRDLPFSSTNGLAKIFFPTGERGTATVKLGVHLDNAASDDVGLTSAMFRANPKHGTLSPTSHLKLERFDVGLTHEHRFSEQVQLTSLAYAYRTARLWRRQDYARQRPIGFIDRVEGDESVALGALYFQPTNVVLDRSYDVAGVEPRLRIKAKTGDVRHTLEVGGRGLVEVADYQQRSGTYPETYVGALESAERRRGLGLAGYLQDRIAFTDFLLVTPGVRLEHLRYRRVQLHTIEDGRSLDVYREGEGDVTGFVPGIGLVAGSRRVHGFFGLHRGFAPPRVSSAISSRGEPAPVGVDESTNVELGTRATLVKPLRIEVAGFLSAFQNQVIVNTNPSADVNLVDAGATTLKGVETAATLELGKALGWPTVVDVGARYTVARSTFRYGVDAGRLLPYAPQHSGSANVDVEHESGVGGQVSYSFVGSQFTDTKNTVAEDVTGRIGELDPFHLVNLAAHYRHKASGLTARLTVKNALDTTYIAARRPEGIQPGAYRLVLVGLRWDWSP